MTDISQGELMLDAINVGIIIITAAAIALAWIAIIASNRAARASELAAEKAEKASKCINEMFPNG